ncbi:hypothetical protein FA13DRAFT_857774 [Coprinellus micaceus]|uniref:Uncharacterized protein n=1 Tax=Coprinellus micaceus TaxID=71717 RepID=A0A4Y7T1C7_COPMI|nr:hypothetical protein FA13DRAFT_857774 [Coprinellus micaceus]
MASRPFAPLDLLYDRILRTSPDPLLAVKWIRFVNNQQISFYPLYPKYLLESYPGETEHVLGTLTSLVGLADENGKTGFHIHHKSLLDFLGDPHRSSDLHINKESLCHFTARGPQSNGDPLIHPPPQDSWAIFTCS